MTDVDPRESEDDFSDALVGSDAEGEIAGVLVDEQRHQQRAAGRTPLANATNAKKIMASRGRATKLVGKVQDRRRCKPGHSGFPLTHRRGDCG